MVQKIINLSVTIFPTKETILPMEKSKFIRWSINQPEEAAIMLKQIE